MIALAITVVICGTVLLVTVAALWHNNRPLEPKSVRRAHADLEMIKAQTAFELEQWKQDWILDQRRAGSVPALPPGTVTIEPPDPRISQRY